MRFLAKVFCIVISVSLFSYSDILSATQKHKQGQKSTQAHKKKKISSKRKSSAIKQVAVSPPTIYGKDNLAAVINNAINSVDPGLSIGVAVKSMKYGDVIYTKNLSHAFVPASILKVFTAEAALLYLGSNYTFKTSFYTDSSLKNGVIAGNLYLVHSGDPTLTYKDLIELMDDLKAKGVYRVDGNVYIDTSAYDQSNYGPGWLWDDTRYCYAAPISASIINHNCLSFQIAPGKNVGHPANIVTSPHHFYSDIQNSVVTKSPYSRSCYIRLGNNSDSSISISGCMPRGRYAQGVSTVISDIVEYNKALLRTLFRQSGVQVNGNISSGEAPSRLTVLATHESKPLNHLITEMLKKSDNIIAGSLFKKLGETYTKQPGSWENGSLAVSQILSQKTGISSNMQVLDGSGLSRYNKITPGQMIQVLEYAFHNQATNYDFIAGLPIAGVDGTLKHRLGNITRKVRAKTGTMKGVNALAGYAVTNDKEPLAFVIIVNGNLGLGWKYKELEDRIVTSLTKYSR